MRKRSLGRGLDALISQEGIPSDRGLVELSIGQLTPNPMQPRADLNQERLEELTLSVEHHGVLQPIIVRPRGEEYEIVAGERRWRAAHRAGLETVPCIVQELSDEESLQLTLIENLQREDLNPLEEARGYRRLINEFALTQEQLAQYIGKSRSAIANTLRLLDLPEAVQGGLRERKITEGHARALLGLAGQPSKLLQLWAMMQEKGFTVRETERAVREATSEPTPDKQKPKSEPSVDPHVRDAEQKLQNVLATKVKIRVLSSGGGRIVINYSDSEEFDRLMEALLLLS